MQIKANIMNNQEIDFLNIFDCTAFRKITLCKRNDFYGPGAIHNYQLRTEHDFVYVLAGTVEIYFNDRPYTAGKDSLLCFHAQNPIYGRKEFSPDASYMFLHITTSPRDRLIRSDESYVLSETSLAIPVYQDCRYHPDVCRVFRDIIRNSWVDSNLQEKRNSALINLLLCEIAAIQSGDNLQWDSVAYDIMQRIHAAPNHFYKLEELSEIYGISTRTISEQFRRASGYPVHQYQLHVKLELAFTMLREDRGTKVRDIAIGMGFSDEFHFARMFKREFGYSPSEIRDNLDLKRRDTGFRTPYAGVPL